MSHTQRVWRPVLIAIALLGASCSGGTSEQQAAAERRQILSQRFPEIVNATFDPIGDTTWSIRVTLSSPYDSPERYADAWRVISLDGEVLGVRELTHDHATEQPFTRALNNVEIAPGTEEVIVEARDLVNGWSGEQIRFDLPEK